jgi:flagellar hook-length control protein FliK
LRTGAVNEAKTEAVDATTTGSTPTENSEAETSPAARAWSNESARLTSTTSGRGPSDPDQADRVRFVQRVARAFEAMGDRGGSVRLRLHPPELGSLRLEITVRNGTMTARLEVENTNARTMLLDNLPALRDRLAEQDIKVGRFDIDLNDQSGGSPERPGTHPQPRDNPDQGPADTRSEREIEGERPPQPRAVTPPGHGSQLDVLI